MITVSKFNVRVVNQGDKYGRNLCLTHSKQEPMVEFYDARYPHSEFGQFIGRYFVATILGKEGYYGSGEGGLCLDGGNPNEWSVSEEDMATVRSFLQKVTA